MRILRLLPLLAGGLISCGSPSDPFSTGPGHAAVQGRVSQSSGLPLANSTVRVVCGRDRAGVVVPTDAAGDYLVQISVDESSLDANSGRSVCHFRAPDAARPRIELDTTLGFARFTQLAALQFVDLREPAGR